jgi:hypothetical protein
MTPGCLVVLADQKFKACAIGLMAIGVILLAQANSTDFL